MRARPSPEDGSMARSAHERRDARTPSTPVAGTAPETRIIFTLPHSPWDRLVRPQSSSSFAEKRPTPVTVEPNSTLSGSVSQTLARPPSPTTTSARHNHPLWPLVQSDRTTNSHALTLVPSSAEAASSTRANAQPPSRPPATTATESANAPAAKDHDARANRMPITARREAIDANRGKSLTPRTPCKTSACEPANARAATRTRGT